MVKNWSRGVFAATGCFALGFMAATYAPSLVEQGEQRPPVAAQSLEDHRPCDVEDTTSCGFQDTRGRTAVACEDYSGERSAVLFTFGQSNSANAGRDRYIAQGRVANFNIHDGRCYLAEDPLLGAAGTGGSVWGVLGDKLIASGHYDSVLIAPFGIAATPLSRWTSGGDLQPRVRHTAALLAQAGIAPTHVLWHQGESDTLEGTATQDYVAMFEELVTTIRANGIEAPIYPAIVSVCAMPILKPAPDYQEKRQRVRAAQLQLPKIEGVEPGPDTDTVKGPLLRYDGCHFTHKGTQAHAELWLRALHDD